MRVESTFMLLIDSRTILDQQGAEALLGITVVYVSRSFLYITDL